MEYWSSDKTWVNKPREPKFLQGLNDAEKAEKNETCGTFDEKRLPKLRQENSKTFRGAIIT